MWRIQTRFVRKMAYLGCSVLSVLVLLAASVAVARTWKSSSGNYQVEADLVKSENGKVTLRKPGGETDHGGRVATCATMTGPIFDPARLEIRSRKPAARSARVRSAARSRGHSRTSRAGQRLPIRPKRFLRSTRSSWPTVRLTRTNCFPPGTTCRFGNRGRRRRWCDSELAGWNPSRSRSSRKRLPALVEEAIQLVESKQADKARKKLSDASREDPESLQANFLSGLICVFGRRDLQAAKQEFYECVRRQPDHVPSLNNLALVEVRLQRYTDAIAHWKTALDAAPVPGNCPEYRSPGRTIENSGLPRAASRAAEGLTNCAQSLSAPGTKRLSTRMLAGCICRSTHNGSENPWIVPDKDMGGGRDGKHKLRIGEDALCMRCGGLGAVKCPNSSCAKGIRAGGKTMSVAGTDPGAAGPRLRYAGLCQVPGLRRPWKSPLSRLRERDRQEPSRANVEMIDCNQIARRR